MPTQHIRATLDRRGTSRLRAGVGMAAMIGLLAAGCSDSSNAVDPSATQTDAVSSEQTPTTSVAVDEAPTPGNTGSTDQSPEPAQAVTRTITVGVAYPDVSAFATLNEKFSIGEPEEQILAIIDGWRRNGLLPVNGIDLEIVFRDYNILSNDDKLGVCTAFAQDEDVFAVVSGRSFTVGAECLTARFDIPTIDYDGGPPNLYERGPRLFTLRPDEAEIAEAYVAWAEAEGILADARIGLMWDTRSEDAADAFKDAIAALGYELAAEVPSDGEGIGSPQDTIAAERFASEGVDVVVFLVGTPSVTNFQAFAEEQNYKPSYPIPEWAALIGDTASASFIQEQFDGSLGMTVSRVGELAADMELPAAAEACVENYTRFSGRDVPRTVPQSAEWTQVLDSCDLMSILYAGLAGTSGEVLTQDTFVTALEEIEDLPMAGWGNVSFGPDDHTGVDQYRTVLWQTSCLCWTAQTEMTDFGG